MLLLFCVIVITEATNSLLALFFSPPVNSRPINTSIEICCNI